MVTTDPTKTVNLETTISTIISKIIDIPTRNNMNIAIVI